MVKRYAQYGALNGFKMQRIFQPVICDGNDTDLINFKINYLQNKVWLVLGEDERYNDKIAQSVAHKISIGCNKPLVIQNNFIDDSSPMFDSMSSVLYLSKPLEQNKDVKQLLKEYMIFKNVRDSSIVISYKRGMDIDLTLVDVVIVTKVGKLNMVTCNAKFKSIYGLANRFLDVEVQKSKGVAYILSNEYEGKVYTFLDNIGLDKETKVEMPLLVESTLTDLCGEVPKCLNR